MIGCCVLGRSRSVMSRLLSCIAILVAAAFVPAGAATHPFTVRDLVAMDRLSELEASPDGNRLAFTRSVLAPDGTRRRTDIWLVAADGTGLRALTTDPACDTSPEWPGDNRRVFFLSSRSGSSQV